MPKGGSCEKIRNPILAGTKNRVLEMDIPETGKCLAASFPPFIYPSSRQGYNDPYHCHFRIVVHSSELTKIFNPHMIVPTWMTCSRPISVWVIVHSLPQPTGQAGHILPVAHTNTAIAMWLASNLSRECSVLPCWTGASAPCLLNFAPSIQYNTPTSDKIDPPNEQYINRGRTVPWHLVEEV